MVSKWVITQIYPMYMYSFNPFTITIDPKFLGHSSWWTWCSLELQVARSCCQAFGLSMPHVKKKRHVYQLGTWKISSRFPSLESHANVSWKIPNVFFSPMFIKSLWCMFWGLIFRVDMWYAPSLKRFLLQKKNLIQVMIDHLTRLNC